jgi:dipeptidase E
MTAQVIVALGGGGFSTEPENPLLDDFVLSLSHSPRPRICFVATGSGDSQDYIERFYRAFARLDCRMSHLELLNRSVQDLRSLVLDQDVIYVGGGSTANLLAIWRLHGLDEVLAEASSEGVLLAGISAGMNCWFEESLTDSFHVGQLDPLKDGLGFIDGSACPHYDGEPLRRSTFRRLIAAGELADGWAADDGVALVFEDGQLREAVSSRPDAAVTRVTRQNDGTGEEATPARYLGKA